MNLMTKFLIILPFTFVLNACATFGNRAPEIDRVKIETQYITVPEEYLECGDSFPFLTPEQLAEIIYEDQFGLEYVVPLYYTAEECMQNMERIRDWNERVMANRRQILELRDLNEVLNRKEDKK